MGVLVATSRAACQAEAMGAGDSAQAEYDRRRQRDRERRRRNLKWSIPWVLLTPLVVYGGVRLIAVLVNEVGAPYILDSVDSLSDPPSGTSSVVEEPGGTEPAEEDRPDVFPASLAHRIGLLVAAVATLREMSSMWGSRQSTEAWGKGAEGERATGRVLDDLPSEFVVIHDLKMPGSRANIDHLVIGPPGVFTIETKNYKNEVVVQSGKVTSGGRSLGRVVAQAQGQAEAMSRVLGVAVGPIVCVHGGGVEIQGWFAKPVVDGVRFCSGRRLIKHLTGAPTVLSGDQMAQLADRVQGQQPVSPRPVAAPTSSTDGGGGQVDEEVRHWPAAEPPPPPPSPQVHNQRPVSTPAPDSSSVDVSSAYPAIAPGASAPQAAGPILRKCWRCNAPMVERERRADGKIVWGCSTHPSCRHTRTDR